MGDTGRRATVVLANRGEVVGALPPVSLELPWWPEVHELVAAVRERDHLDITVLRLVSATSDRIAGGEVMYLAETDRRPSVTLRPWPGDPLAHQPLRQRWASPGGPAELLAWAADRLSDRGAPATGPPQQTRTWNLSAMWRIPTTQGTVWFKAVPEFFAHEGAVIDWIGPPVAPRVIDFASGRTLLADVAGVPNHDVRGEQALRPMVSLLTDLQRRALGKLDDLAAIGVPDRRLGTQIPRIATVVEHWGTALEPAQRRALDRLVSGLSARVEAVGDCGVPDTLVHGDFHSGNVAGTAGNYVILDWGDSFIGHPLLDELAFTAPLPAADRPVVGRWFVTDWERIVPGSDPVRAAQLLEPMVGLLAAVMYANFCDQIEPDERIYHSSDALRMLQRAASHIGELRSRPAPVAESALGREKDAT